MFLPGLRLMLHTILLNTFPSSLEWRVTGVALNQEIPGTPSSSKKNPALQWGHTWALAEFILVPEPWVQFCFTFCFFLREVFQWVVLPQDSLVS